MSVRPSVRPSFRPSVCESVCHSVCSWKQLIFKASSNSKCADYITAALKQYMIKQYTTTIGYEPAGLTVHPPPQNDRGWVHFFRMGV